MMFVVISTVGMCLNTMETFQVVAWRTEQEEGGEVVRSWRKEGK